MSQPIPSHHGNSAHAHYYVPDHSYWPIIGSIGLGIFVWGLVGMIHDISQLRHILTFGLGVAIMVTLIAGWFHNVIKESMGGLYSPQMDRSFRIAMIWFIFSEVMFFMAFFGALFFVRQWALPWLGGAGHYELTGKLLWPEFVYNWPLLQNPDTSIVGPQGTIPPMGIPLINTLLLLTSGITVTWAHYALKKQQRGQLNLGLFLTVALAIVFLGFQIYEFGHAYNDLGLTLNSGIYGSTFFMLTGFHGLHVTIGTIMLIVILFRSLVGHFSPEHHFAFEATAWYWHFVDVVWVGLFIFVYIF